jgi:hypothetical protein
VSVSGEIISLRSGRYACREEGACAIRGAGEGKKKEGREFADARQRRLGTAAGNGGWDEGSGSLKRGGNIGWLVISGM